VKDSPIVNSEEISADNQVYTANDYGDVTNQNISDTPDEYYQNVIINRGNIPIKTNSRFGSRQNDIALVDDLRRSFESSLMFDNFNEQKLNHILDKRESFSQIRMKKNTISYISKRNNGDHACKICLDSEVENENVNPMISPCSCTGSMKDVHLECLKEWIHNKRNTRVLK
jgi:hypothetical protein